MSSKQYRMQELINPASGRSLVIDTSNGLSLGPLSGLEDFIEAVSPILPWADGIVTSAGQSRRLTGRTQKDAALLVSGDWSNAFRGKDFVLPPERINFVPLLNATDALNLGASGLVMHFLLGHEESIDAQCMQQVVQLALEGTAVGMPLIVDVHPIGPRVVLVSKAVELGVSYALEGGADGVVIPWPGGSSFDDIQTMAAGVPVWIKPDTIDAQAPELTEMLEAEATGFWLNERLFVAENPVACVQALHELLHKPVEV
jgi:DhnA family fructose-bisphosphate aldolase class Ia